MIYEADKGSTREDAARKAFAAGCEKFVHNEVIFRVSLSFEETGEVVRYAVREPAAKIDVRPKEGK